MSLFHPGGQVGVEIAAEIVCEHKSKYRLKLFVDALLLGSPCWLLDKNVTIVHSRNRLIHNAPVKLHNKVAAWMSVSSSFLPYCSLHVFLFPVRDVFCSP
jgi:hypothetical protein